MLQTMCCSRGPTQGAPLGSGSCSTVLFRNASPPPQEALHSLQGDHSLNKHPAREARDRQEKNDFEYERTASESAISLHNLIMVLSSSSYRDIVTCHSSPLVGCPHRKDRPLYLCKYGFLSFGLAHMKLSRSSKGSRHRTQGRRAWCTPECRFHTHCRQRGNSRGNRKGIESMQRQQNNNIKYRVIPTKYYSQLRVPLWEGTPVCRCLMGCRIDTLPKAHRDHPAAIGLRDTDILTKEQRS